MSSSPYLNVIVPFWNTSHLLLRTLESVVAQTERHLAILLVDDHSTDDSFYIAKQLAGSDSRIHVLKNGGVKGAQGARMTGIRHSTSEWIAFLDSDDQYHPSMLEKLWQHHLERPNVDVITCFSHVVKLTSNSIKDVTGELRWVCNGDISSKILTGECYVDTNGAIIRKSKLLEIGGLDEQCPSFQEWDTHIRLAQVATYATVEEHLVDYYDHSGQMSKNPAKTLAGFFYILRKHRTLWIQKLGSVAYARKCASLVHLVNQLPSGKWEALRKIVDLHPLVPPLVSEAIARHLIDIGGASVGKGLRSCRHALRRSS
jgi:glycosyltransferase involved in cell wall biosynthesis